jgi:purine catabolism regulator
MWRTFDVGAVVESLPFSDALVAAGAGGMARPVNRARLAATPDHLRRVGAKELLVTTAETLLATGDDWEHLLARLDAAQVAAIAVRLDPSGQLPAEMLAAADRLSLPVITFPEGAALADVTTAVLDALLEAQSQRLQRVLDIHQRFTRIVLARGGAPEIAATLHALLGCPISVVDAGGRTTVVVPSDASGEFDLATTSGVRQPIVAGDHQYGEIVALTDGTPFDDDQLLALERASMAIAVRLAHASAVAEAQERFAAISLEELIAGHAGDAADVAERATSLGWDLGRPRAVLLASIDPPTDRATLPTALGTIAAAARATLGRDAIVWTRSTTIAALVAPDTDAPAERRRIAEQLRHELDQRLRAVTVSIGVGRRVDDPTALPRSYLEASRAVDVGRWAKGRHVTEVFDELGLERLLASTPTDDLAEFVQHAIGPLVEHDRSHHTDLVETLGVWLETRNMAEAARRIHVHYNTFKNRLERIEDILGPVVTDAARSLECEVAIYVARHYDGPWAPGPEM